MRKRQQDGRSQTPWRALIILNGVLLAVLAAVTFSPGADAQGRVPGEYTMVAGGAKGSQAAVVYIVDTVNHQMIALAYDPSTNSLSGAGARNLAADAGTVSGGTGR